MTINFSKKLALFIVIIFFGVTAFLAFHLKNVKIDASADTLLTKGNEHYITAQETNQTFQSNEFILIAFKPNSASIFSNQTKSIITEISDQIRDIDRVESVRSLVNIPIFTELDSIDTNIDPQSLTWAERNYTQKEMELALSSHPLYEGLFYNADHSATSLQVNFKPNDALNEINRQMLSLQKKQLENDLSSEDESQLQHLQERKDKISQRLDKTRSNEIETIRKITSQYSKDGEFYLGGGNLLSHQLIKIIKSDLVLFGSLISAIICVLLYILFGQLRWVALPALCCSLSVAITLGLLGLFDLKVTVISTNVVALQIILTLAIVVHLMVQYNEYAIESKHSSQKELLDKTINSKIKPCFYAGLTTSVGFGSLVFSGVAPVISFGWMMVIAMTVTLTVSLLFFPSFLLITSKSRDANPPPAIIRKMMLGLSQACEHAPKLIILVSFAAALIGTIGCLRLSAENSFLNYFDSSTDVYRELSYIDKEFGGSTPFDILYTAPESHNDPNLIISAESIQDIDSIHNYLDEQEAIGNVTSIADFATVAKVTTGKPLTEYEITALYRTLDKSLQNDLFGAYYSPDKRQARISTRVQDTTQDLNREKLVNELNAGISKLDIESSSVELTGLFILYQDILSRLVDSQITTLSIVYLAMALILLLIFRSFKIAIICLIPNIITTALIMGVMGWASIPLDLMTITIAAVAMGISVDDTIHYTHRFLEEAKKGTSDAIKRSNISVGYALVYTTLIIVIGFSSLLLSDFTPSVLFGALTSAAMIVALITDITVLPVLLKKHCQSTATSQSTNNQ